MNVRDLIDILRTMPQDAEVHVPSEHSFSGTTEADEVYESTVIYGLALPEPRTVPTVVIDYCGRGL